MIDRRNIKCDVFRAGFTPPLVRLTHIPTGLSASATDPMQTKAYAKALAELESKLLAWITLPH